MASCITVSYRVVMQDVEVLHVWAGFDQSELGTEMLATRGGGTDDARKCIPGTLTVRSLGVEALTHPLELLA